MRTIHLAVPLVLAASVPLSAQTAPLSAPHRHQSFLHVAAFAAGGLILGGWTGYVTAQIVRSDWQDPTGRATQRLRFSVGGAALGLVAGVLLGTRGTRAAAAPQPPRLPLPINRPIAEQEIRRSHARTISQLLHELRPHWLRARGTDVISVLNPNAGVHAANGVVVYLNGTPFGDLTSLDEIPIEQVTGIQFLDGPAAVLRYGTGNEDGAILLSTAAGP
jgi:hypothetical protein